MNFFLHSRSGELTWLAQRLEAEGNQVNYYVNAENSAGQGLVNCVHEELAQTLRRVVTPVERAERVIDALGRDLVVVFDGAFGRTADALRRAGCGVIAAGVFNDVVVESLNYAAALAGLTKLPHQPWVRLMSWEAVHHHIDGYSGNCRITFPSGFSFVASGEYLKRFAATQATREEVTDVILRQVGEDNAYVIGVWFNGYDFVLPAYVRSLEPGGWVTFAFRHWRPKQFRDVLLPLRLALRKVNYCGPVEAELERDALIRFNTYLEPGFFATWCSLVEGDIGRFLADIARNQAQRVKMKETFAAGISVNAPREPSGIAWPVDVFEGLRPMQVSVGPEGLEAIAGAHVGVVVGVDTTASKAVAKAYEAVDRMDIPRREFLSGVGKQFYHIVPEVLANVGG